MYRVLYRSKQEKEPLSEVIRNWLVTFISELIEILRSVVRATFIVLFLMISTNIILSLL